MLLAFNQDIGPALQNARGQAADDDAIHIARAANTVRRDKLKTNTAFSGSFDTNCKYQRTAKLPINPYHDTVRIPHNT